MKNNWDILKKELSCHGFVLNDQQVSFSHENQMKTSTLDEAIVIVTSEIKDNIKTIAELWDMVVKTLSEPSSQNNFHDRISSILFIASIKDLLKLIACFDAKEYLPYENVLKVAADRDIEFFSSKQVDDLINIKITIDWTHRVISRQLYIRNLLSSAKTGQSVLKNVKVAAGVSGPWSNVDLPMEERVFPWKAEEENIRGRELDLRKQRRYTAGFENYNNGGPVGEGYYARELKNEPYLWKDRKEETSYPERNILFWN